MIKFLKELKRLITPPAGASLTEPGGRAPGVSSPPRANGEILKAMAMARAIENAGPAWEILAYNEVLKYARYNFEFMAEDVRLQADIPAPPSARAWGAVILKASKTGVISRIGYDKVKSPGSHHGLAAVWESNIYIDA